MQSASISTEPGPRSGRDDALARVRRGVRWAYWQSGIALVAAILVGFTTHDSDTVIGALVVGGAICSLALWLSRSNSPIPAAILVILILGLLILQVASGGKPLIAAIPALFAWRYGQAFEGARELRKLEALSIGHACGGAYTAENPPSASADANDG